MVADGVVCRVWYCIVGWGYLHRDTLGSGNAGILSSGGMHICASLVMNGLEGRH